MGDDQYSYRVTKQRIMVWLNDQISQGSIVPQSLCFETSRLLDIHTLEIVAW